MGRKRDISPCKISEIKSLLLNTNMSHRKIASITKVSRATVDRIKKKLNRNEPLTPNRIKRCGRKKITTPRDERKIRDTCVQNRKAPRRVLTSLIREAGVNISAMTFRRRAKDLGFSCRRPAKKPLLTKVMKKKRLQWALDHQNWTVDDWKKVSSDDPFPLITKTNNY